MSEDSFIKAGRISLKDVFRSVFALEGERKVAFLEKNWWLEREFGG